MPEQCLNKIDDFVDILVAAGTNFHIVEDLPYKLKNKKNTLKINVFYYEPTTGLEPVTSSLPRKHSTAELSRPKPKNHTRKA